VEGKATLPLIRALLAEPGLHARLAPIADGADPTDEVCLEVIAAVKRTGASRRRVRWRASTPGERSLRSRPCPTACTGARWSRPR